MNHDPSHCQSCGEPLSPGGVCAACAFGAVLAVPESAHEADSWLGETDTPQFSMPGRLVLPARFGEYELRREIASGGMGVVYEAWHARARRTVALKMVRGHGMASPTELARFKVEAEAAAQLDHPHIVPIHEIGECEGQPFFTMKLIEGGSLAQRLKREKTLPPREAATLMAQVARAVHHAHQRGVLHRDLKPGNILLDAAGTPYLTDFGLARINDAESGLTLSSAHLGTPHYMSPEQAAGRAREVSTASDVWALGVMLYQMLSGRLPFPGSNGAEVMRRILEAEAPSLSGNQASSSTTHTLDRDLATIVARCMEKDAARRLGSAFTLAEELERWLAGEPIRLRPVTGAERFIKWCRRHPGRVAAISAVSLSLLVGTAVSLIQWHRAETNAAEARTARDAAAEDGYFATIANAYHERERFDFASARRLLTGIPAERRGFEWRLINALCRGDETWSATVPGDAQPRLLARDPSTGKVWLLASDRALYTVDSATGAMNRAGSVPLPPDARPNPRFRGFRQFAFSPDGAHYFVADGPALLVVESSTGRIVRAQDCKFAVMAAWLDAQRVIFAASSLFAIAPDTVTAWTWNLAEEEPQNMPAAPIAGPFAVSPDGARVAWVRGSGPGCSVIVRPVEKIRDGAPECVLTDSAGPSSVTGMAFSGDGKSLAVAWNKTPHGKVSIYSVPEGEIIRELPVPPVSLVAWDSDAPEAAVFGQNPWLTLLHRDFRAPYKVYDDSNHGPGDYLDVDRPIKPPVRLLTRSVQSGSVKMLFGHEAPPVSAVFLPGESSLLSAAADGTVRRWPLAALEPAVRRINLIDTAHLYYHPTASPGGHMIAGRDSINGRWFVQRFGDHSRLHWGETESVMACFDDGRVLVRDAAAHLITCWRTCWRTGGPQPEKLWDSPCGGSIQGFRQIIHSAQSADSSRVAVLMPGKFIVVDMDTRAVRETDDQVMEYASTPGQSIALSPDGRTVAVTGFTRMRARFYNAADLTVGHRKVEPAAPLDTFDTACAFSADGKLLYVGNEDGRVRVFEAASAREIPAAAWKAHTTAITALTVSRAGDVVATASEDSLALWSADLKPGKPRRERLRMSMDRARNWMHFTTGDAALLHCAPERPVEKWEAIQ